MFLKQKQKKRQNQSRKKPPKKKKGASKKGSRGAGNRMSPYARLLMDPCNAPLVPGMHGPNNGYLSRLKKFVTLGQAYPNASSVATCGYVIWSPRYHSEGSGAISLGPGNPNSYSNAFVWLTTNSALVPENLATSTSAANPQIYGSSKSASATPQVSTYSIPDPANDFVVGGLCQDARLVSACMRVTYLGTMNASDGQFCFIKNLPMEQFLYSTAAGSNPTALLSVDRLFELADAASRLGLESHEVRYRDGGSDADRFIAGEDQGVGIGANAQATPPLTGYISGLNQAATVTNPNVIGFAFRGFTAGQLTKLSIELHKNIEWRPAANSGIGAPIVTQLGESKLAAAETFLDRYAPSWETMSGAATQANLSRLVQAAKTGYDVANSMGLGNSRGPHRGRIGGWDPLSLNF